MMKKIFALVLVSLLFSSVALAADPFHGSYGDDESLPVVNGEGGVWNLMRGGPSGKSGLNVIGGVVYEKEDAFEPLPLTVYRILNAFLQVFGVIFVIIIVYSGFRWMTAGGNEEHIEEAKKWIRNGIIGLAIVFAAYAITLFVFNAVVGDNFKAGYDEGNYN
ncbi:hypothetical protein HY933_04340 [Candidatus Falkowbacteria bacterium]|nr:hypothetical protein [Candidatus Falkowbacteria bacterium]